ncbi:glycoside hydrolase family 99-like domain-containing protein [Fusobacterium ulcerans]|uniref:glycosyltransferase WbsX family protein n=1 Tax=Fusobacterium ulcerans TaxID=861 RepID=UPI0030A15C4B
MKIIAYYLPQFHEIKENNLWWGKGFTEWTNVKNGKKLFKGQNQPLKPLNDNYYNLLNKKTIEWQTKLGNEYGIYGFCYYHYWFKGKKILEKPAENLLKWKEIKQNFCFCWANHSWKKTWNGLNEILIKQEYGVEEDWEEHFKYLKNFFKDERYIKIENKPILMIYNPKDINKIDEIIAFFDKKCKEINFSGIYIIESLNSLKNQKISSKSEAVAIREPLLSLEKRSLFQKIFQKLKSSFKKNYLYFPSKYEYEFFMKNSLELSQKYSNKKCFPGVFTGWDNTSRHGRRGYVIKGNTPKLFKEYLLEQKKIMKEKNIEYIFLNAWNEWAEGMYLEPDEKFEYGYLEAVKEIMETEV